MPYRWISSLTFLLALAHCPPASAKPPAVPTMGNSNEIISNAPAMVQAPVPTCSIAITAPGGCSTTQVNSGSVVVPCINGNCNNPMACSGDASTPGSCWASSCPGNVTCTGATCDAPGACVGEVCYVWLNPDSLAVGFRLNGIVPLPFAASKWVTKSALTYSIGTPIVVGGTAINSSNYASVGNGTPSNGVTKNGPPSVGANATPLYNAYTFGSAAYGNPTSYTVYAWGWVYGPGSGTSGPGYCYAEATVYEICGPRGTWAALDPSGCGVDARSPVYDTYPYCEDTIVCNCGNCINRCGLAWSLGNVDGIVPVTYFNCGSGCFAPETEILMGDHTRKKVKAVKAGDLVWNPGRSQPSRVKKIVVGPEPIPMIELGYGDTRIQVTTTHPIPTQRKLVPAQQLTLQDSILGSDGKLHRVTIFRRLPLDKNQYVWNLLLDTDSEDEKDHLLVAGGIVTGDYFLQERLQKTTPKP